VQNGTVRRKGQEHTTYIEKGMVWDIELNPDGTVPTWMEEVEMAPVEVPTAVVVKKKGKVSVEKL
jgi:hypothetical protein